MLTERLANLVQFGSVTRIGLSTGAPAGGTTARCGFQPLERRLLCSAAAPTVAAADGDLFPPVVTQVYVSGDRWAAGFKHYVRGHTYGSSDDHGFGVFNGEGMSSYLP